MGRSSKEVRFDLRMKDERFGNGGQECIPDGGTSLCKLSERGDIPEVLKREHIWKLGCRPLCLEWRKPGELGFRWEC